MPKARSGLQSSSERSPRMRAEDLDDFFEHASANEINDFVTKIKQVDIGERENDNDIQRFFDYIGWAEEKPEVLGEVEYQQAWADEAWPQQYYHSDQNGAEDAREYAKQYFGMAYNFAGDELKHYISNGVYGGGTYYANSAAESAYYGTSQFRGFLNSNAKVISWRQLQSEVIAYSNQNPAFASFLSRMNTGYGGAQEAYSIYAAMKGYNVIDSQNSEGYIVVLNRKATTVSRKTKRARSGMSDW